MLRILCAALVVSSVEGLAPNRWQARLDRALLDIDLTPQARIRNLQRALQDPEITSDVQRALQALREKGFKDGHPEFIETLWPKGTTARADLEGLQALTKQVPEVVENLRQFQPARPTTGVDLAPVASQLAELATDQAKLRTTLEDLQEEAKNALRATPKGLETPDYEIVTTIEDTSSALAAAVEVRQYEPFSVAATDMATDGPLVGSTSGGKGFNTLAAYLFGENSRQTPMKMTAPVEIRGGSAPAMSFVLPSADVASEGGPPEPLEGSDVRIENMPARLVAAKPFAGVATDAEVARQRVALADALAEDGSYEPVDADEFSVLQYNAPYTIPWRRRNELAVVVVEVNPPAESVATEVDLAGGQDGEDAEDREPEAEITGLSPELGAQQEDGIKESEAPATGTE